MQLLAQKPRKNNKILFKAANICGRVAYFNLLQSYSL
jgi:hypothetical protein